MNYWIEQLGFWGYIRRFPINPITMVGAAVLIGILVMLLNAKVRKNKANAYLMNNSGAAVMAFFKKQVGNNDYAENIRIVSLNGETAHWFFLKPAMPGIYLMPGENTLVLYSEWARGGSSISMYKSDQVTLKVFAEAEGHYSLEYYIPEKRYIFEAYDNPQLFSN